MLDLGLRDWLLILGPILIIGVLIHGYWRMRNASGKLKISLDKSFADKHSNTDEFDELELLRAELPNGGARIVKRFADTPSLSDSVDRPAATPVAPSAAPPTKEVDLAGNVPVLMEPVELNVADDAGLGDQMEFDSLVPDEPLVAREPTSASRSKPTLQSPKVERPEKLIIMSVLTKEEGGMFKGQNLLETFVAAGLVFGAMDIFHCHDKDSSETLFSLVNALEPGTFNINEMEGLRTPGVSLFAKLHEARDPVIAFERMVTVVKYLARELNGVVKDRSHSTVTNQTLAHERQLVKEYSAKYALHDSSSL